MDKTISSGSKRTVAVAMAMAMVVLGAAACEPPPPPDGRDLGIALVGPPPSAVEAGSQIEVSGTLTNHGTSPATEVAFAYGITSGFSVDSISLGPDANCSPAADALVICHSAVALASGASLGFVLSATAGETPGSQTHMVAASSSGTEPVPDANPNTVIFETSIVAPTAPPTPLDIGGGANYLGTGDLLGPAGYPGGSEDYYLSVNPYCTDKINGDRYQSGFSERETIDGCAGTPNAEYRAAGYTYAIDVPAGRTSPIDILLWDARYNEADLDDGEAALDSMRREGAEPFTFTLYEADDTPYNNNDNPILCTKTFVPSTPFEFSFLGSQRWNTMPCQISAFGPSGRYVLGVKNSGMITSPQGDGANAFGVVAAYASAGLDPAMVLCEGVEESLCPVVSGMGTASLHVSDDTSLARIDLGRVRAHEQGRLLKVWLFDPGEGGQAIRVLAPSGPGTWTPSSFAWEAEGVGSGAGTSLSVTESRFNGRLVEITVDLDDYVPSANDLWKIEYQFSFQAVRDRTTWDAAIVDAPAP